MSKVWGSDVTVAVMLPAVMVVPASVLSMEDLNSGWPAGKRS